MGKYDNPVVENIITRRSIKKYKKDMVPRKLVEKIAAAGTYAPTGRGMQAPVIIAVTNKEVRDRLSKANGAIMGRTDDFDPFYGAPVVLVVLADKSRPTYIYDGSLVMQNLMLAANSYGVGSCWIHRAKEEFEMPEWKEWLKSLGIEGDYEGIGHCVLGYPDYAEGEELHAGPRKITTFTMLSRMEEDILLHLFKQEDK